MNNFQFFKLSLLLFLIPILWTGCSEEVQKGLKPVPTAFGDISNVVVVADKELWDSRVGDTLMYYYAGAYPILPQPEPLFDIRHMTPKEILSEPVKRELRNYIILCDLSDMNSPTTRLAMEDLGDERLRKAKEDKTYNSLVGRDKWAKGQLLIYNFGFSYDEIIKSIKVNFPGASKKIREAESNQIEATVFAAGESRAIGDEIRETMGFDLRIPGDFFVAINDKDVIWMKRESPDVSSNILLKKMPYSDKDQLSKKGIKALRDSIGRKYVSSEVPGTYMKVNDKDLPMFTYNTKVNNCYALEARGIWEIQNDFMAGAFVSYLVHNPTKNELYFLDGFVYAPGKDKRDFMKQLDYLLSTVTF